MRLMAELKVDEIHNGGHYSISEKEMEIYKDLYTVTIRIFGKEINSKLDEWNEESDSFGIEPSFDPDAQYNVFMREKMQKAADQIMMDTTGGLKYYYCLGAEVSFEIDKDFIWHMHLLDVAFDYEADMYMSLL